MKKEALLKKAWKAREYAHPWKSGTKVGCAIETESGKVVTGFNIEGLWMTSIHAEVNAICQLVKTEEKGIKIALVAKTEFFTPCGACLDWLFQFCDEDSLIIIQNKYNEIKEFKLNELMPFYPKK